MSQMRRPRQWKAGKVRCRSFKLVDESHGEIRPTLNKIIPKGRVDVLVRPLASDHGFCSHFLARARLRKFSKYPASKGFSFNGDDAPSSINSRSLIRSCSLRNRSLTYSLLLV